jgi:hypothetical protein
MTFQMVFRRTIVSVDGGADDYNIEEIQQKKRRDVYQVSIDNKTMRC